jgi:hypothetical protein
VGAGVLDGVDVDDVVVRHRGGRPRLPDEALAGGAAAGEQRGQHLDGNDAVQLLVEGPQNDPRAARADDVQDLVMP